MLTPHVVDYFYVKSVEYVGSPARLDKVLLFRTSRNLMNFFPSELWTRDEFMSKVNIGDIFITRLKNGDPQFINFVEDPAGDRFVVKGRPDIPVLFDWDGYDKNEKVNR